MDYETGRWVYACQSMEVGPSIAKQSIGLDSIVRLLKDPLRDNHIQMLNHHHQADVDAQLTRLVYSAVLTRAKSAAKPNLGKRVIVSEVDEGTLDADMPV